MPEKYIFKNQELKFYNECTYFELRMFVQLTSVPSVNNLIFYISANFKDYNNNLYTQVVDNERIIKSFFWIIMGHYSQDDSLDDDNIQSDSWRHL